MASAGSWCARDVAVGSIGRWCAGQVDVSESCTAPAESGSSSGWCEVIVGCFAWSGPVAGIRVFPVVNHRSVVDITLWCKPGVRGVYGKEGAGQSHPVCFDGDTAACNVGEVCVLWN